MAGQVTLEPMSYAPLRHRPASIHTLSWSLIISSYSSPPLLGRGDTLMAGDDWAWWILNSCDAVRPRFPHTLYIPFVSGFCTVLSRTLASRFLDFHLTSSLCSRFPVPGSLTSCPPSVFSLFRRIAWWGCPVSWRPSLYSQSGAALS